MSRFDIVLGHYVFCSQNHGGQGTALYSRLSRIQGYFKPGAAFSETRFFDTKESELEEARRVFRNLCGRHHVPDPFRVLIAVDRDEKFAPCSFLICRVKNPEAGSGHYDWDTRDEKNTVLVQTDWDRPGLARTFGWSGDDADIEGATEYLDICVEDGKVVEDQGYFASDEKGGD